MEALLLDVWSIRYNPFTFYQLSLSRQTLYCNCNRDRLMYTCQKSRQLPSAKIFKSVRTPWSRYASKSYNQKNQRNLIIQLKRNRNRRYLFYQEKECPAVRSAHHNFHLSHKNISQSDHNPKFYPSTVYTLLWSPALQHIHCSSRHSVVHIELR